MLPEPENLPAEDEVIAELRVLREEYAQNAVGYTWSVRSAGYTSDARVTLMSEMSKAEYDLLEARYQREEEESGGEGQEPQGETGPSEPSGTSGSTGAAAAHNIWWDDPADTYGNLIMKGRLQQVPQQMPVTPGYGRGTARDRARPVVDDLERWGVVGGEDADYDAWT